MVYTIIHMYIYMYVLPLFLTILLVLHADDDLGSAVVAGDHVGRHLEHLVGRTSQTKVQDLGTNVHVYTNVS